MLLLLLLLLLLLAQQVDTMVATAAAPPASPHFYWGHAHLPRSTAGTGAPQKTPPHQLLLHLLSSHARMLGG
jgi:hypothetical protein